jgi:hypothetical protein
VCLHNTKRDFWEFPNGDRIFLVVLLGEWGMGSADWLFLIGIDSWWWQGLPFLDAYVRIDGMHGG